MKPFKFTLQSVRTLRQRREQEAMERYARVLLERAQALERLQAAERALSAARAEWQARAQSGCCGAEMARFAGHCQGLAATHQQRTALLGEAERRTQASLKEMLWARQQREAVEKFLTKQQLAYDRALNREDQKFLDDLAQRRVETSLAFGFNEESAL